MKIQLPRGSPLALDDARAVLGQYPRAVLEIYDQAGNGPHDDIRASDVTSLAILNAFGGAGPATAISSLWRAKDDIQKDVHGLTRLAFEAIPEDEFDELSKSLDRVLTQIEKLDGVGSVVASKFLHRLRPNIVPIWDKWAGAVWYPEMANGEWAPWILETYTRVHENLAALLELQRALAAEVAEGSLPVLRIWDILLWTKGRELETT